MPHGGDIIVQTRSILCKKALGGIGLRRCFEHDFKPNESGYVNRATFAKALRGPGFELNISDAQILKLFKNEFNGAETIDFKEFTRFVLQSERCDDKSLKSPKKKHYKPKTTPSNNNTFQQHQNLSRSQVSQYLSSTRFY